MREIHGVSFVRTAVIALYRTHSSSPSQGSRCHPRPPAFYHSSFVVSQEMVGAAGPLRKGDEVEYLVPEGKAVEAGRRAVGAIRVQVRTPP